MANSDTTGQGHGQERPGVTPFHRPPERVVDRNQIGDLDIPTFIRRQMD